MPDPQTTSPGGAPAPISFSVGDIAPQSGGDQTAAPAATAPKPVQGAGPISFHPNDINMDATHSTAQAMQSPAAQPGAYQQSKGAKIQNSNADAAHPFSDSVTSVIPDMLNTKQTGAMMKRDGESDTQFLARVHEAAKHVTPDMVEKEERSNIARTYPTVAAAPLMGVAQVGLPVAAGVASDAMVDFAVKHLAGDVFPEMAKDAAAAKFRELGATGLKYLIKTAAIGGGLGAAAKWGPKVLELLHYL